MENLSFSLSPPKNGIIGHRGLASLAPENTWASFMTATQYGLDWIEFDLQLTGDRQLVIFHDDTLERTTNGAGFVFQKTRAEIENLDAGSWFHSDFREEKIPVFTEILSLLLDLPVTLNIELKYPENPSDLHLHTLVSTLVDTLQHRWPPERPLPLISSFHWEALHHFRKLCPAAPIGFLTEDCSSQAIAHVKKFPNASFHCNYLSLTPAFIVLCHNLQIPLLAYTVNEPEIAKSLLKTGLFGLFSDKPPSMLHCEHL